MVSQLGYHISEAQTKNENRAYARAGTLFTRRYLSIAKNGCHRIDSVEISPLLICYNHYIHQ